MKSQNHLPPRLPNRILEFIYPKDLLEEVLGDLYEYYQELEGLPNWKKNIFYWFHLFNFLRPFAIRKSKYNSNIKAMLRNYLLSTFRNLKKHKVYAVINILGLSMGIAASIVMLLYAEFELSYDMFHSKRDNIYRLVALDDDYQGGGIAKIQNPVREVVKEHPDVLQSIRLNFFGTCIFKYQDKLFSESGGLAVDYEFFRVFDFEILEGNVESTLKSPNKIILTKSMAIKYFGFDDWMNKTITISNFRLKPQSFVVGAVIEDIPNNSHFNFDFLLPMANYDPDVLKSWQITQAHTYIVTTKIPDLDDIENVAKQSFLKNNPKILSDSDETINEVTDDFYRMQPLSEIYLNSGYHREIGPTGNIDYLYIALILAIFILIIAAINFINLATARATTRLKDVGIRKANGATANQLIGQYLTESVIMAYIAMIIGLAIVFITLPGFNATIGTSLVFDFGKHFLPVTLGVLIIGLGSGLYPAIQLSRYGVNEILRNGLQLNSKSRLRQFLVIFQYVLSIILIICTAYLWSQIDYMKNKNLGFEKERIVVIGTSSKKLTSNYESFIGEIKQHPGIERVSFTGNLPGGGDWGIPLKFEGIETEDQPAFRILEVDENFIDTYGMKLKDGRNFSREITSDQQGGYIINEEGVRQLGWKSAVGKRVGMLSIGREMGQIIGVLEDFHYRSMREKIEPIILFWQPAWSNKFSIKLSPKSDVREVTGFIKSKWNDFDELAPFDIQNFDQELNRLYAQEDQLEYIVRSFMIIALIIASIGLFGLTSFSLFSRTKELGIRKVLGASSGRITVLLTKEFILLIFIAAVIAVPAAIYGVQWWLQNFAYTVSFSVIPLAVSVAFVFLISTFTIIYHVMQASKTNPVEALRCE